MGQGPRGAGASRWGAELEVRVGQLVLMRHSRATHKAGFEDVERPLTGRGRRNAAAAGVWLRDQGLAPDLVLCSPSTRTRQTWDELSGALDPSRQAEVWYDSRLYLADDYELREIIGETPDDVGTLLVIGHNPTIEQVAGGLTGQAGLSFPTSAIAVVDVPSWVRLPPGAGTLHASWVPAPEPS
jgi:phosphohistidine phosphatase